MFNLANDYEEIMPRCLHFSFDELAAVLHPKSSFGRNQRLVIIDLSYSPEIDPSDIFLFPKLKIHFVIY